MVLQQLNSTMRGRSTQSNVSAMRKMLTLWWPWAWHCLRPGGSLVPPAHASALGCGLTGWFAPEESVLPGLPASLQQPPCLPALIVCRSPCSRQCSRSLYGPLCSLTASFRAVACKHVLPSSNSISHSISDAVRLSFTCQDPVNNSMFSFLIAGDTANHCQSLELASNFCVTQSKDKSLV